MEKFGVNIRGENNMAGYVVIGAVVVWFVAKNIFILTHPDEYAKILEDIANGLKNADSRFR